MMKNKKSSMTMTKKSNHEELSLHHFASNYYFCKNQIGRGFFGERYSSIETSRRKIVDSSCLPKLQRDRIVSNTW